MPNRDLVLLSLAEAAEALGRSTSRLRRLAAAGRLKGARKVGGRWLVEVRGGEVVAELLTPRRTTATVLRGGSAGASGSRVARVRARLMA